MQISNRVCARGFLLGWEVAQLGNALSCLATLVALARRTGLPATLPFAERYADLFLKGAAIATYDPAGVLNRPALAALLAELEPILSVAPIVAPPGEGTPFADLGATASGVVWRSRFEGILRDWRADGAEDHVRRFCRGGLLQRGNGLVIAGAYWRHYTDMRGLAVDGAALRRHLGALRPDGLAERRQRMAAEPPGLRIGLHVRQGDYAIWLGGRYFFTPAAYGGVIDRLRAELGDRPHSLYLFSEQPPDEALTGGRPVYAGQGTAADDFLGLSRCDVVVGPPSTFATWAAFLGGGKRLVLTRETLEGPLLERAVDVVFPTGAYLPGDPTAGPL